MAWEVSETNIPSMAAALPLLLLVCRASLSLSASLQPQGQSISYSQDLSERQENGSTATGLQACATSFCPEAIANVTAVVVAVVVLFCLGCFLWHCQVQQERADRIKQAMARNKALDKHAETLAARQQQRGGEAEEETLLTSPSRAPVLKQAASPTTSDSVTVHADVHQ